MSTMSLAFGRASQLAPQILRTSGDRTPKDLRDHAEFLRELAVLVDADWQSLPAQTKNALMDFVYGTIEPPLSVWDRLFGRLIYSVKLLSTDPDELSEFVFAVHQLQTSVLNVVESENGALADRLAASVEEAMTLADSGRVISGGRAREFVRQL